MRPLSICVLAVLVACGGGKSDVRPDSTKVEALVADTTSTLVADTTAALGRPVDTTRRIMDRPARVDHATEEQKRLRNLRLKRP